MTPLGGMEKVYGKSDDLFLYLSIFRLWLSDLVKVSKESTFVFFHFFSNSSILGLFLS